MSTITLNSITSGYNVNKINDNFNTILGSVNTDLVHVAGGQNVMGQDLDLNSNKLLNVAEVDSALIKINGLPITTSAFVLGNNVVGQSNMQVGYDASLTKVADLASTATGKGAALVAYEAPGSSTPTTVKAQIDGLGIVSVKDPRFGAKGDGVTDDSAAIATALAYAGTITAGATVYFPAGTYAMGTGQTVPVNTTIAGAGKFSTSILLTTAGMTGFTQSHATQTFSNTVFRDLAIASNTTGTVGIYFVLCVQTAICNVAFLGVTQHFNLDRGEFHQITDCIGSAYGLRPCGSARIWSSTDTEYCTNVSVKSYILANPGTGNDNSMDVAAIYIRRGVSVFISHFYAYDLELAGGGYQNGIVIENDSQGCKISDSCIVVANVGVTLQQGAGVVASPYCTALSNVDIDQSAMNAYELVQCTYTTIFGGFITPIPRTTSTAAVVLYSGALYTTITGTMVQNLYGASGTAFTFNGSAYTTLENCQIDTCTYGFNFNGQTHTKIFNTTLRNCTNKSAGTLAGAGNFIANSEGLNPITVTSPAMVATGTPYANTTGVRCAVIILGGTVAGIYLNGNLTGLTQGQFDVSPNETLQINYSAAPTWTWIGH